MEDSNEITRLHLSEIVLEDVEEQQESPVKISRTYTLFLPFGHFRNFGTLSEL